MLKDIDFKNKKVLVRLGSDVPLDEQGNITDDEIPPEFFGCAGVAEVENLQDVLLYVMRSGHRHHVNITPGVHVDPLKEALEYYLEHDVVIPQYG